MKIIWEVCRHTTWGKKLLTRLNLAEITNGSGSLAWHSYFPNTCANNNKSTEESSREQKDFFLWEKVLVIFHIFRSCNLLKCWHARDVLMKCWEWTECLRNIYLKHFIARSLRNCWEVAEIIVPFVSSASEFEIVFKQIWDRLQANLSV